MFSAKKIFRTLLSRSALHCTPVRGNSSVVATTWRRHQVGQTKLKTFPFAQIKPKVGVVVGSSTLLLAVVGSPRRARAEWVQTTTGTLGQVPQLEMKKIQQNGQVLDSRWRVTRWSQSLFELTMDMLRAGQLVILFLPCAVTYPFMFVWGSRWAQERWSDLFVSTLTHAGPAFIKLGQWASTRSDLVPAVVRARLVSLRHSVAPESWSQTLQTLSSLPETVIFPPPESVCDSCVVATCSSSTEEKNVEPTRVQIMEVEVNPLGAGCIAQVHRARAKVLEGDDVSTDRTVMLAVKVRRYGVVGQIRRDLSLLKTTAWVFENVFRTAPWLALVDSVNLFGEFIMEQIDLNVEAENLRRFHSNFSQQQDILFPRLIHGSESLVVETLEQGVLLSHLLEERSSGLMQDMATRQSLAQLGVRAFLKMLIEDNFVHSDLHPGNIICQLGTPGESPKLVFLDVGLCTELSKQNQRNFLELFMAVARGNGKDAARLVLSRSRKTLHGKWVPEGCVDPEGFVCAMDRIVSRVKRCTFTLGTVDVGAILRDVLHLVRKHRVELDPHFTSLVMSIIVLEGVGRELDPNLDLFAMALPVLSQYFAARTKAKLKALMRTPPVVEQQLSTIDD